MRVITNLDPDTYERVEELVETGGYRDVNQFLRVAVQNQISLEGEGESTESISSSLPTPWGYNLPNSPPVDQRYEMDRDEKILFQQYYRFLPLIVVMAELAEVTADQGGPVSLEKFRKHMEDAVTPYRDALQAWEEENDIKKTERKSTGFPSNDVENPEYSMKRFLDQYVGRVRQRDGEPISFGNDLALISYSPLDEDMDSLIQLTPSGREFLDIGNPLLANGPESPSLSEGEREYLASHIRETLPEEHSFISLIYETLPADGSETYTTYLDQFIEFLADSPAFTDDDPSESRVRSTTGGALSRMVELGILSRGNRRGVYIPETHPDELADGGKL